MKIQNTETELNKMLYQNQAFFYLMSVETIQLYFTKFQKILKKPSDFDGVVYESFDEYGAWKGKLTKEMKKAKIYIDEKLADRI